MVLHTIIARAMNGKDAIAIFSSHELAEAFLKNSNMKYQIEQCSVQGDEPAQPKTVFACHKYHAPDDIHYFTGLYWNYDQAKRDGGEKSLILNLDIDSRK
jgi:hypothetical protein